MENVLVAQSFQSRLRLLIDLLDFELETRLRLDFLGRLYLFQLCFRVVLDVVSCRPGTIAEV